MWPFSKKNELPNFALEPTSAMIEEAKKNPNGWVYQIDGQFAPHEAVPPESIVGAYAVDANGKLTGEFKANPKYRGR
jgi:hypothetical protein